MDPSHTPSQSPPPPTHSQSGPHSGWPKLHLWQIQPLRDLLVLATVFGVIYLGYKLSVVTVPLLLALMLAYLFEPLVRWLTLRTPLKRTAIALTIIVLGAVAVVGPVTLGIAYAGSQGATFVKRTSDKIADVRASVKAPEDATLRDKLAPSWARIRDYIVEQNALRAATKDLLTNATGTEINDTHPTETTTVPSSNGEKPKPSPIFDALEWLVEKGQDNAASIGQKALSAGGGVLGGAVSIASTLGSILFAGFLTAFFFFFVCTGYGRVLHFWEDLIPERKKARVFYLVGRMDRVIAGFVRGRLTVCAVMMVVYSLGYFLIGAPVPLVLGPLIGMLTIIPYASGAAAPIVIVMLWLNPSSIEWQNHWWWVIAGPLIVLAIAQFLDDWILTPAIQGKTTEMATPTILFASIAGGSLAGVYGLLLAIPVAACIKIILEELFWPRFKRWAEGKEKDFLPIQP